MPRGVVLLQGIVACHEPPAAAVGRTIFEAGGNAADVAVATALAQIVANPFDSSLSGKAVIHVAMPGVTEGVIIDAGHVVGERVTSDAFAAVYRGRREGVGGFIVDGYVNAFGYKAIMAFGFVQAMQLLHQRFGSGRICWGDLFEPAIRLATDGFDIYPKVANVWDRARVVYPLGDYHPSGQWTMPDVFAAGNAAGQAIYYKANGKPYRNGERFVQLDHARTLTRVAEDPESFYRGDIAALMAADFAENGAFVTLNDISNYEVVVRRPITINYRDYEISANPPPGSGMLALIMLNILEGYDLSALRHNSTEYIMAVGEAMRAALLARARYRGDPKFVDVPIDWLISKNYAAEWRQRIVDGNVPTATWGPGTEGTTHVSVMTSDGGVVSMTHSHGGIGGAGVATPGLGFLHNHHMSNFDPLPGSVDSIVPGKRHGGSVPLIVRRNGEPVLAIGGAGGTRQVTGTVQTILNFIDHGMEVHEAISAPRFHSEQPGLVLVEPGISEGVIAALCARGRTVRVSRHPLGRISAVSRDPDCGGELGGGSETRSDYGRGNVGFYSDDI